MTLAIIIVLGAFLSLALILWLSASHSLAISHESGLTSQIQPIDVEAFRNLIDPADDEYLRRRLPAGEFRVVRRARLRAIAAYVQAAGKNATILVQIGEAALAVGDPRTQEAARQLVNEALLLRTNSTLVLAKVYVALVWPMVGSIGAPLVDGYAHLNGSAMLLGRLQNPIAPLRVSTSSV
jgi:hypothetical protein